MANDDNTAGVWSPAGEEPECTGGGESVIAGNGHQY